MIEAGVVIGLDGKPIHWHTIRGRTSGSIPDSRDLWDVLWENRGNLLGFAHSHPGYGTPSPSWTDVTTFAAVEAALGMRGRVTWWVASANELVAVRWSGPGRLDFSVEEEPVHRHGWFDELRIVSGYAGS